MLLLLQAELPVVSLAAAFVSVIIVITERLTQAVRQAPVAHQARDFLQAVCKIREKLLCFLGSLMGVYSTKESLSFPGPKS